MKTLKHLCQNVLLHIKKYLLNVNKRFKIIFQLFFLKEYTGVWLALMLKLKIQSNFVKLNAKIHWNLDYVHQTYMWVREKFYFCQISILHIFLLYSVFSPEYPGKCNRLYNQIPASFWIIHIHLMYLWLFILFYSFWTSQFFSFLSWLL